MYREFEIDRWEREEHYNFFINFDETFHGIVVDIECGGAYKLAKDNGYSFYATYLHASIVAAMRCEPFRYRIVDGKIRVYDQLDAGTTFIRPNKVFAMGVVKFHPDLKQFNENLKKEQELVNNSSGLRLSKECAQLNMIHHSTLPWIKFRSLSHARSFSKTDSIPKITFGKATTNADGKMSMPVAINVNHALVDGVDVANYVEILEELMR